MNAKEEAAWVRLAQTRRLRDYLLLSPLEYLTQLRLEMKRGEDA